MALTGASLGTPLDRVDGRLKVTGQATYAADTRVTNLAYGALVLSTMAKGKIDAIDVADAEKLPGVLAVITHKNAQRLRSQEQKERPGVDPKFGVPLSPLQDDVIRFNGQPISLVIADTLEQAIQGASLIRTSYRAERGITDFGIAIENAFPPKKEQSDDGESTADKSRGNVDQA